jgi:hypothetical protein
MYGRQGLIQALFVLMDNFKVYEATISSRDTNFDDEEKSARNSFSLFAACTMKKRLSLTLRTRQHWGHPHPVMSSPNPGIHGRSFTENPLQQANKPRDRPGYVRASVSPPRSRINGNSPVQSTKVHLIRREKQIWAYIGACLKDREEFRISASTFQKKFDLDQSFLGAFIKQATKNPRFLIIREYRLLKFYKKR